MLSKIQYAGIAAAVGFASKSSFNSEFQRLAGQTPTQFRKNGS